MSNLVSLDCQTSRLDTDQLEQLLTTAKAENKHCEIDWVNRTIRILSGVKSHTGVSGKVFPYCDIILEFAG